MDAKKLQHVVTLEKLIQYSLSVATYDVPLSVPVLEFCNGFTVRNIGTSTLIVMGDPLAANESKAVGGNRGEVYVGRIDIKFSGAGTNLALITQKYYMNVPRNDSL